MRILIIEDDLELNNSLCENLQDQGYAVDQAFDGEEGQYLGENEAYDAIILDIGLPILDGLSILENWRKAGINIPVLILTARDRWSDKVAGIDAGADDYVAKPFHIEEVLARLRALIRRSTGHSSNLISCGEIEIDTKSAIAYVSGKMLKLTSFEYRLLAYMMHHQDQVISRTELTEHLYDQEFDRDSNVIEVFVGRLRKKINSDQIQTIRGMGYCLSANSKADVS